MENTPEQRAAAAARSARYRARKREQAAAEADAAATASNAASVTRDAGKADDVAHPKVSMVEEVDKALGAMRWIMPSDGGAIALAKLSAGRIDSMVARNDDSLSSRISTEEQTLIRLLHEIGGTPTVRMQHELRSMRMSSTPSEAKNEHNTGGEKPQQKSNVSKFERPKRGRA